MSVSKRVLAPFIVAFLTASCGSEQDPAASVKAVLLPTKASALSNTAPTLSVAPVTTTTSVASGTLLGLAPIASNFNAALGMQASWGSGAIPKSGAPDVVGAFRFICRPGQVAQVDPIVNPGPRGTKSHHLHQFFGNTKVYSDSTYASLRAEGGSTCNEVGDPYAAGAVALNRSAYWMPAMMDGAGRVVRPDFVSIYYKRRPATDPIVSDPRNPRYQGKAVDLPHGLRFIFGRDMTNLAAAPTGNFDFKCVKQDGSATSYRTMALAVAACPKTPNASGKYAKLAVVGGAPECWDGKNLDTPNHRSHVAYPSYGSWGYLKCPSTHPYVIPTFTMGTFYTVDANLSKWVLASDSMMGQPAGSTYHADFFMAWDPTAHRMFHDNCINKLLNCSGGDMGNGKQLKGASASPLASPRLVPIPAT